MYMMSNVIGSQHRVKQMTMYSIVFMTLISVVQLNIQLYSPGCANMHSN